MDDKPKKIKLQGVRQLVDEGQKQNGATSKGEASIVEVERVEV